MMLMAFGLPLSLSSRDRKCLAPLNCYLQPDINIATLLHSNKPPVKELLTIAEEKVNIKHRFLKQG